ncbi:Ribosomal RNA-processing protein [Spironucleus salmonicida]|uniref:Ribosomal RNA-processing protein 8 n=1 Tax=Spironucleus salmonicida TaxID=348837 RepID=V6LY52_9EUKA|nr:Ribosomal RNA-processing protein [Spironucleus salmonicida]|eukprot:EST49500.1 Ribosomal RNA-processing protein [Spironucleus salmonicida]
MKNHKKSFSTKLSASEKVKSAKFRLLNEQLYTQPTAASLTAFQENPQLFAQYHEGFRLQTTSWQLNPVDLFADCLQNPQNAQISTNKILTKKTNFANLTIFDIGCGDAKLQKLNSNLTFRSFDLQVPETAPFVEVADATNLPAAAGAADVCIFSLSLMGEPAKMLSEAFRVLSDSGELWVAEVGSRSPLDQFVKGVESVGFRCFYRCDYNYFHVSCYEKGAAGEGSGRVLVRLRPCVYKRR